LRVLFQAFRQRRHFRRQTRAAAARHADSVEGLVEQLEQLGERARADIRQLHDRLSLPEPRCRVCGLPLELRLGRGAAAYWTCAVNRNHGEPVQYINNGNWTPKKHRKPARVRRMLGQ